MAARPRLLPAWLKAHEAGRVAERVEELREQVSALKKRKGLKVG